MLLALDTSTQILSIALHDGETLLAEWTQRADRQHSALLAPLIKQVMAQTEIDMTDLSALAVSIGPGSFTGTRIGVALAKGLAAVNDLPLVPVTTLETVVAAYKPGATDRPLIATVVAGRQRVIWAAYHWRNKSWHEEGAPIISTWNELIAACEGPVVVSGEISQAGSVAIQSANNADADIRVSPAAARLRRAGYLAEVAWCRLRANEAEDAFPAVRVMPIYLRGPG